jgi:hypothetical protein
MATGSASAAALELRAIFIVCGHNILHGYNRSRHVTIGDLATGI